MDKSRKQKTKKKKKTIDTILSLLVDGVVVFLKKIFRTTMVSSFRKRTTKKKPYDRYISRVIVVLSRSTRLEHRVNK